MRSAVLPCQISAGNSGIFASQVTPWYQHCRTFSSQVTPWYSIGKTDPRLPIGIGTGGTLRLLGYSLVSALENLQLSGYHFLLALESPSAPMLLPGISTGEPFCSHVSPGISTVDSSAPSLPLWLSTGEPFCSHVTLWLRCCRPFSSRTNLWYHHLRTPHLPGYPPLVSALEKNYLQNTLSISTEVPSSSRLPNCHQH